MRWRSFELWDEWKAPPSFFMGKLRGFSGQNVFEKEGKKNGTENVDCAWTCSQKSAAPESEDDVSGSTCADLIGSHVYQQSIDGKYEDMY